MTLPPTETRTDTQVDTRRRGDLDPDLVAVLGMLAILALTAVAFCFR